MKMDASSKSKEIRMIESTEAIAHTRESILLVEDDQDLADMFQLGLESAGFAVERASDGLTAIDLALSRTPDLVLMDQGLPVLNGLEALERLRSNRRGVRLPVVMFSNRDDDDLVQQASALGAVEWVVKSRVTPGQLAQRVGTWLDGAASNPSRGER